MQVDIKCKSVKELVNYIAELPREGKVIAFEESLRTGELGVVVTYNGAKNSRFFKVDLLAALKNSEILKIREQYNSSMNTLFNNLVQSAENDA